MLIYCDTSALIKRYIAEDGSAEMAKKLGAATEVAISLIGLPELCSAVYRLGREGLISDDERDEKLAEIREDWQAFLHVPVQRELENFFPEIFRRSPLKGADAVHLASALLLRDLDEDILFVCADGQLARAAERMGCKVLIPGAK